MKGERVFVVVVVIVFIFPFRDNVEKIRWETDKYSEHTFRFKAICTGT